MTAALELLRHTEVIPLVLEESSHLGGISRTEVYRGNRIDIGGHRFFSRSRRVMEWWLDILPLQREEEEPSRQQTGPAASSRAHSEGKPDPESSDRVMLRRSRLSRILHRRRFLDYPLRVGIPLFRALGPGRVLFIMGSYLRSHLSPIRPEKNLEDFFINRFGRLLYETFFKDYTEKVWGVPCHRIPAEWGAQRVKGLSVAGAVLHALRSLPGGRAWGKRRVETSLIDRFFYPKLGPGQLWEEVGRRVEEMGGVILRNHRVEGISSEGTRVVSVRASKTGQDQPLTFSADFFISTMPIRGLISALNQAPARVREVARGLVYRDFLTVGLLLKKLDGSLGKKSAASTGAKQGSPAPFRELPPDNWIYIQEKDVKLGRMQIFNNWSPYLVQDPTKVWVGLEYFCFQGDELWNSDDRELERLGARELERLGFIEPGDVLDGVVIRQPKAYPAYLGTYHRLDEIREYTDSLENLFLIGRNGMHRYNNMDHSMLAAMEAVKAIKNNSTDKAPIWAINSEDDYHEG